MAVYKCSDPFTTASDDWLDFRIILVKSGFKPVRLTLSFTGICSELSLGPHILHCFIPKVWWTVESPQAVVVWKICPREFARENFLDNHWGLSTVYTIYAAGLQIGLVYTGFRINSGVQQSVICAADSDVRSRQWCVQHTVMCTADSDVYSTKWCVQQTVMCTADSDMYSRQWCV